MTDLPPPSPSPSPDTGRRVDRVITSGTFSLDGQDFEVENNIWLFGDDQQVVVVDAAHQAQPIVDGVAGRTVVAIVCTHGHNDHVNAAVELAEATGAPILLHPADRMLWDRVHPDRAHDGELTDGELVRVAGVDLHVLHTPGHSPGGICLYDASDDLVFGGDTLFRGGPGATGRSFSSFDQIIDSIRGRLLVLPDATVVHTGHGDDTTIGEEAPHLDEWIADHQD
jgi:glyoxylase-like metal-dependent hydrolase (beta-lactamase superfamily II)